MEDNTIYEIPEHEDCPHGIRNEEDCVMCIEENKKDHASDD